MLDQREVVAYSFSSQPTVVTLAQLVSSAAAGVPLTGSSTRTDAHVGDRYDGACNPFGQRRPADGANCVTGTVEDWHGSGTVTSGRTTVLDYAITLVRLP